MDSCEDRKHENKERGHAFAAKLMLNSLYGKFSLNPKVQSKVPYFDRMNKVVKYKLGPEEEREPIYVPVGAFITSYAREVTIRASQAIKDLSIKKYGQDMYIYSDTDSIHTLLPVEDVETIIETSDTELENGRTKATL